MKSPKDHRPAAFLDPVPVLATFIKDQYVLLDLLEKAKAKNIGRIRVPVSLSRFIRLKAGDTFRFLVAHEQRHFLQIKQVLEQVKKGYSFSIVV